MKPFAAHPAAGHHPPADGRLGTPRPSLASVWLGRLRLSVHPHCPSLPLTTQCSGGRVTVDSHPQHTAFNPRPSWGPCPGTRWPPIHGPGLTAPGVQTGSNLFFLQPLPLWIWKLPERVWGPARFWEKRRAGRLPSLQGEPCTVVRDKLPLEPTTQNFLVV